MKKFKKALCKKSAAIMLTLVVALGVVPTGSFQTQAAKPADVTVPSVEATVDKTDWTNGKITITGTVSDQESGVAKVYYQKGEEEKVEIPEFDTTTGAYSVTINEQAYEGDYKIIGEDNEGNLGEKVVAVRMDNVAPSLSEVKANMDWSVEHWTKGKVVVTGQASDNLSGVASVTWKKQSDNSTGNATLNDAGKFSFEIPAQNYEGNYIVICTDNAGNMSVESTVAVKMDVDKCIVSTCTADKTDWTNGKVVVSGTVTDNLSGVSTIKYKKEGAGTNTVIRHNNGSYSFEIPAQDYNGNYIVICTDKAGNTLEYSVPVKMDKTAPIVDEAKVSNEEWTNGKVVISGKVSDALSGVASVSYKRADEENTQTVTPNAEGRYNIEIPAQSYKGNYVITCTDAAGNVSEEAKVAVKMDNTASEIESNQNIWKKIVYEVTFGLFYKDAQEMIIDSTDNLSGIKTIDRAEKTAVLGEEITLAVLKGLDWTNIYTETVDMQKTSEAKDTIAAENKNIIYCVRVTDYAGNISYLTSDGMIFDVVEPKGEISVDTEKKMIYPAGGVIPSVTVPGTNIPLYGIEAVGDDGTVEFDVHISESKLGENQDILQSGIKSIVYDINMKDYVSGEYHLAISQDLYSYTSGNAGIDERFSVELTEQNGRFKEIVLNVTDYAGNTASDSFELAVDITKPEVNEADANITTWTNGDVIISGKVSDESFGVASVICKKDNGDIVQTVTPNEQGEFSFTIEAQNYSGDYVITCTDYAGNISDAKPVQVLMDNKAPTVTTKRDIWREIVYKVTFGLFYKDSQKMVIDSVDNLSGIKTIETAEKHVQDGETIDQQVIDGLSWKALYSATEEGQTEVLNQKDSIPAENKNIIFCVKVTDYAGNISYLTSDGLIFDVVEPKGEISVDTESKMVYPAGSVIPSATVPGTSIPLYGIEDVGSDGTVEFDVNISESNLGENQDILQSGIASLTYKIEAYNVDKDAYDITETGTLVENGKSDKYEATSCIKVKAGENNSNSVIVTVTVTDRAGNEASDSFEIAIDTTAPIVEATPSTKDWTKDNVEITITVSEMPSGVQKVTCKRKGSNEEEVVEFDEEEGTFKVVIQAQNYKGNYVITCTDYAGNISEEVNVEVKMDNVVPTAKIKFQETTWIEKFFNIVSFGTLFSNKEEKVDVEVNDNFSGIKSIKYLEKEYLGAKLPESVSEEAVKSYLDWETTEISKEQDLEEIIENAIAEKDKNVVIYVWVTDYANNEKVFSSEGIIIDETKPVKDLDKDKLVLPKYPVENTTKSGRMLFNTETVPFVVKVTEPTTNGVIQSGIQSVTYTLTAKDRAGDEGYKAKTSGELYKWVEGEALETEYTGEIVVVSKEFNYNYVDLTVTVIDNAGNSISETYPFAIDITVPEVAISYENNTPVHKDENQGYYDQERIATITYTERAENWEEPKLTDLITATDINGVEVSNSYVVESPWETKLGETADEDTHEIKIKFTTTKNEGADARHDINTGYSDSAGNEVTQEETVVAAETIHPFKFTIDTVIPEIVKIECVTEPVEFVEWVLEKITFGYYDRQVEVKVTISDNMSDVIRLSYEGVLDEDVSDKNKGVAKNTVEGLDENEIKTGNIVQSEEEGKKNIFTTSFYIPESEVTEENSFRGTVKVQAYDYCENDSAEVHDSNNHIVVDKIAPVGQVIFEEPIKEVDDISYYDKDFEATIIIDEANFYAEDVIIMVNDEEVVPTDWTQDGDVWTSHISFTEENDYIMTIEYSDRSGNEMEKYVSNQKTLDRTNPVIAVSNIKHQSANNQDKIGFTLTVTDKNIAASDIKPAVVAVVREGTSPNYTYVNKTIPLGTPSVSTNARGETVYTYTVSNLEIDGYYSLKCTAVDHVNHSVSNIVATSNGNRGVQVETVNFSVNRDGSVFWIETEHTDAEGKTVRNKLNNAYVNGEVLVKIHELNVDRVNDLNEEDKQTVLTLNDGSESRIIQLIDKAYAEGNYDKNVRKGSGGWYETIYTLDNKMFEKDGTYSLNILTYDMAQNSNVNTKSEEGTIKFVVDRTKPVITANVKSKQIIDASDYMIEFKIAEVNLDESTIVAKLNGKEVEYKKSGENTYQFKVKDLLNGNITISAKDSAGNSSKDFEINKLTISANWYVRWYANQPLFWGTIGGAVGLLAIFVLIVLKKRREDER